ncbi:MAG: ABC transporter ATP-binding protein [Candidatus Latescibacteria bacterium]|nr:ABC transporter ATP-binding protein [Candidatus Latescibacterota bacterium]
MGDGPAIEAVGVTKTFGGTRALRGVDLTVTRGDFLSIFGPNGAGKSTLLGILSTLVRPTSGTVRVEGWDVREEAHRVRGRIGVISHQTLIYDDLTAWENLCFYGRMYGLSDLQGRVERALTQVGLAPRGHDRAGGFSRGMKQRLSIARSTLHDPSVLLLDEPFTGLDPSASDMLSGLLRTLKEGGRTVVMITHDIAHGLDLADRVALLVQGRWAYQGAAKDLNAAQLKATYERHAQAV